MTTLCAFINGVGLLGPGLDNWLMAQPILSGTAVYESRPLNIPLHQGLPRTESRRVSMAVKVALAVAQEAVTAGRLDARQLACVFSSSTGDGDGCNAICQALAYADRHVSPIHFHNSVHNAPAGYWGIAVNAMTPATVLCAYDSSFGAGLLEALSQVLVMNSGVLLVTYEAPYPEPLHSKRPYPAAFGLAMALMPQMTARSIARLEVGLIPTTTAPATTLANPQLEALRTGIPAARGLSLLQALAQGGGTVRLDYLAPQYLAVRVTSCH